MFEYTVELEDEFDQYEVVEWNARQPDGSRTGRTVFKSRILEEAETICQEYQYHAMCAAEELNLQGDEQ
jgi:hypothetical protein